MIENRVYGVPTKTYPFTYVMFCAIWYFLYNLKNVKNTHGGVLFLVKLQAKSEF